MSDAATIARALHGRRYGSGWIVSCPVADHGKGRGDKNPSCTVKDGDVPGRVLFHCFAGCDPRDILDELRRRGLVEERAGGKRPPKRPSLRPCSTPRSEPEQDARALRLWLGGRPIIGTPAESYLTGERGLSGPFPPSLRFACVFDEQNSMDRPALVTAVTRPDRKIIAVQVTFVTEHGTKAPVSVPRRTIGAMGTGAIRLAPCTDVLGLAEGVEKALAAMHLTGVPTWASAGAWRLHNVTVPDAVRELHLFADNDDAGRKAAERTAVLHTAEGRRVLLRFPPPDCKDWDDFLRARARLAAA